MGTLLSGIITIFIIAPVLLFILIYLISRLITGEAKRSLQLSADLSTFFFIISVHFIVFVIWQRSLIFILLFVLVLSLAAFGYLYYSIHGNWDYKKIVKGAWRFNFLLFLCLYLGFMVYGVLTSAFHYLVQ